jgi:hypothetical protein
MTSTGQTTGRPTPAQAGATRVTRGVRNNNPGNIDRVAGTNWQGAARDQTDSRFVVFISPEMGVRALVRTLMTYFKQHRIRTVRGVINRWAPPVENNTAAYVDAVCRELGRSLGRTVNADETLDIDTRAVMRPLVVAIIAHENAGYCYTDAVIDEGLRLGGVADVRPKALLATGEVQGAVIAATPVAVAGAAEIVSVLTAARDNLTPVAGLSPILQTAVVALSLIGCGLVIWSRLRLRRKTLA